MKPYLRLVLFGLILALGCNGSRSGTGAGSSVRTPVRFAGVVERIDEGPDTIAVAIRPYAAMYHLPRSHPSFDSYRRILQSSLDGKRTIMFTYQDEGPMLTHIELGP